MAAQPPPSQKLLFGPSTWPVNEASSSSKTKKNSFADFSDIFDDQFFPDDLDFTAFFQDLDAGFVNSNDVMKSSLPDMMSGGNGMVQPFQRPKPEYETIKISMPTKIPRIEFDTKPTTQKLKPEVITEEEATISNDEDEPAGNRISGSKKRQKFGQLDLKDMTVQQKLERRERNREHAKRSRIRKKVLLDSLQDELLLAREQNIKLRRIVADRIPNEASRILEKCTALESSLLSSMLYDDDDHDSLTRVGDSERFLNLQTGQCNVEDSSIQQGAKILVEPDYRLIQSLVVSQQNFVLSDPSLPDNPIVYASEGFCKLSGYKRNEVVGRNCRFLQGPGTDQAAVDILRQGVAAGRDVSVCLLNYKADGTPFWNQFFVGALRDLDGNVVNYVGVQCEVNIIPVTEFKDRVKKLPIPDI